MKGFQNTILIIVVIVLSAQLAHFTYMKFLYPTQSVLDDEVDTSIRSSTSLDELLEQYRRSEQEVKAYEDSLAPEENRRTTRRDLEPYQTNRKLRQAIQQWERKEEQIKRMVYQWTIGLLLAIAGTVLYLKRMHWIGTTFIVAGLAEMIWWCSPSISAGGSLAELERILNIKLLLTVATTFVFAANWWAWKKPQPEPVPQAGA
jgi:cation transport ATPase